MSGLNMCRGFIASILACALLAACTGDQAAADGAQVDNGLPRPGAVSGSVTGMPNPGVAARRPQAAAVEAPGDILAPIAEGPMDGVAGVEVVAVEDPDGIELQSGPTLPEPLSEADTSLPSANPEPVDAAVPPSQP